MRAVEADATTIGARLAPDAVATDESSMRRMIAALLTATATCAVPATARSFHATPAWDTSDIDRRLARAVERLVELGVSAEDADAFDGELGE